MKARSYPVGLSLVCLLAGPAAMEAAEGTASFIDPNDPAAADIRRLGERTIDQAGNALVAEVRRVLATTPPAQAIGALHLKDYKLPAAAPGKPAVTALRRTSLRVRNPVNAPDAADQAVLDLIKEQREQGDPVAKVLVQRVTLAGRPAEWRVYRPLVAMKQCVECHGARPVLAPGVADRLHELFPDDRAVDYDEGDWRGIIRVSITEPAAGK